MRLHRLVIIGLDAADYHLTQTLMEAGELPRLSKIAQQGCSTVLKSTIPPQTAPAWTTITTGVDPGKHGIYYFHNFARWPITITNSTDTSTPRIWDYVGSLDARSVVVNVPVTYPAQEVKGAMVSGIPPWYYDNRSVVPESLLTTLRQAGYETDAPVSRELERRPDEMVSRMMATERTRLRVFIDLLKEAEWTFGMVVVTALDRLQHKAVGKGPAEDEAVRRGYREVDKLVGEAVDAIGPEVNYLVVSDHGFNERPLAFYPNAWLYSQGLLKRKSSLRSRLAMAAHDVFDGHLLWLPLGLTKRFQGATTVVHTIDAVDLERSRAFVPGTDGVMVVKSEGDEKTILSGLSGLRDDSGLEYLKVYTRDQVYKGSRVQAAPQVLIVPRDDINIRTDPFSKTVLSSEGSFPKGNHSSSGIFLAAGPDIAKASELRLSINDVAPIALKLIGINPPPSMDGRPVDEVFRQPLEPLVEAGAVKAEDRSHAFSEKEEKQVMENLRRLGYA